MMTPSMLATAMPHTKPTSDAVNLVRAVLAMPDDELDYASIKLTLDRIIDPSIDEVATMAELDRMTEIARLIIAANPTRDVRLAALRTLIYRSGPWNDHRPFAYDHANFRDIRLKLIPHYLATRLGGCVSMPVLFLILAERLGLKVALSMTPNHVLVRHTEENGHTVNLEATSGAEPSREAWYRENTAMSDRSIESGLYLRTLSRREGVALMASVVIEYLNSHSRYHEAIAVCETILRYAPRCGHTLANLGNACFKILKRDFLGKYRSEFLIPLPLRPQYAWLRHRNQTAFASAKALGWEPNELVPEKYTSGEG